MSQFTALGVGLAVSAAFIYMVLRLMAANPSAPIVAESVSRHAFWTAVIAFFASGTAGLENLWATPDPHFQDSSSFPDLVMHAAAPGFWLGAIYLIGQYTWPRHLQPIRSASLEVRSVKKVVPKYLAGALLLVTILSSLVIVAAWSDSGAPSRTGNDGPGWSTQDGSYVGETDEDGNPVNRGYNGATDQYGNPVDTDGNTLSEDEIEEMNANAAIAHEPYISGIDGTQPGSLVGPYLAGGLGLVLISVVGITTLVVRRPPLQPLDAEENDVLRTIWINRLLRTAVIAVSGFGTMSLQYLAQGVRARAAWELPPDSYNPVGGYAESVAEWLTGAGGIWLVVAVAAMAAWAPPRLNSFTSAHAGGTPLHSAAFSRARDFLFLAQGAGVVLAGIAFFVAGVLPSSAGQSFEISAPTVVIDGGPSPDNDGSAVAANHGAIHLETISNQASLLLCLAGMYLLVQLVAAHIVKRRLGGSVELAEARKELLPLWFILLICFALATGLASGTAFAFKAVPETKIAVLWMAGIVAATAALATLLYRAAASRPVLEGASSREDFELRVVIAQRGARLLGGVSLIAASIMANPNYWAQTTFAGYPDYSYDDYPSGFQFICLVLGIALCFLPASTAYARRTSKPRPSVSASA